MRLTINFLLKRTRVKANGEAPVYVRVTLNFKRIELSTGITALPEMWDESAQQMKDRIQSAKIINNRLMKIKDEIQDYYNQLRSSENDFDVKTIKNRLLNISDSKGILEIFDYYLNSILEKLNKGYSMETYKHYKSSRKGLAAFIKYKYKKTDYAVDSINYNFLDSFDIYLKRKNGVQQNTAWNYHKHLRRVLNLAVSLDDIQKNPYNKFKVKLEETHRAFLTTEELSRIEEKEIQIERLAVVRDIFVFACYTGLSYSDISKLSTKHLQKGVDNN